MLLGPAAARRKVLTLLAPDQPQQVQTAAAQSLGVSRKALSELLNGKAGISAEMAGRVSIAFKTTPESWLAQQAMYDLWQIRQKRLKVKRLVA